MLQVDLDRPNFHVEQFVQRICASLGYVKSVKIHRSPTAFALVEMASHAQTLELAAKFGGSVFGTCVLIHLEHAADTAMVA